MGYWIVDVATPERAYAIAAAISAAPGTRRIPTNMPIEVRRFAAYEPSSSNDGTPGIQASLLAALEGAAIKFCGCRKGKRTMKYILMMNCPRTGYEAYGRVAEKSHRGPHRLHAQSQ